MNRQQLNTTLTLRALGLLPPRLDLFDGRLIIQKAIYLAQAAGHDCGHYFRWYLRGPYSPDLTRDVFGIKAEFDAKLDDSDRWELEPAALSRLSRVKELIPHDETRVQARKLELLASVHFLVQRKQVPDAGSEALVELLKKYDKDFDRSEVEAAMQELHEHELLRR